MLASLRTLSRHLGLTALPRLRRTPGETSIQDWRASYGNVDVVSFPLWPTVMAGRSGQMSHCSGFQPLVYLVVCSLADYYLGFGCSWFGKSCSTFSFSEFGYHLGRPLPSVLLLVFLRLASTSTIP